MKKILISVIFFSFILTGCSIPINTDSNEIKSSTIDQETIDNIKNQIISEIRQELENEYRQNLTDTEKAIISVAQTNGEAVLGVSNFQKDDYGKLVEAATGSGVIYKNDNNYYYLVTNNHVIEAADEIDIVFPDKTYIKATLIGADEESDLAVVKFYTDKYLPTVKFGDSDELIPGQFVIAIGNPLGYDYYGSVTLGIFSGMAEDMSLDNSRWTSLIQHDAAINPGNSGGALFDISGNLVGINNMKIVEEDVSGIGFAIPANTVQSIIQQLEEYGKISRPAIGIKGGDVAEAIRYGVTVPNGVTSGVYISEVINGSGAFNAGIVAGDVIIKADGEQVNTINDLITIINRFKVGDVIKITFNHNGVEKTVDVILQEKY